VAERKSNDVLSDLEALEKRLREFLSLLANENAPPESLARSWSACQLHDEPLAALPSVVEDADAHTRTELGARMSVIRCLNAVAVLELQRQQGAITAALSQTRKARAGLEGYDAREDSGESCDIAG